jgi:hypothetical protein
MKAVAELRLSCCLFILDGAPMAAASWRPNRCLGEAPGDIRMDCRRELMVTAFQAPDGHQITASSRDGSMVEAMAGQ